MVLQTVTIAFLVLMYGHGMNMAGAYLAVYTVILSYLLSPVAPMGLLWLLQASVMPLVASARVSYMAG
jgi:hypothetical protein